MGHVRVRDLRSLSVADVNFAVGHVETGKTRHGAVLSAGFAAQFTR